MFYLYIIDIYSILSLQNIKIWAHIYNHIYKDILNLGEFNNSLIYVQVMNFNRM